jgi:hypothetical protein
LSLTNERRLVSSNNYHKDSLRGLRAAAFIAGSLAESKDKEWIVSQFDGDEQLVNMWISFVRHNRWVNKNGAKEAWSLTDKGKKQVNSLMKGFMAIFHIPLAVRFAEFDPAAILAIG